MNNKNDIEVIGVARDGLEAYKLITTKLPDIVILDIIMPQLDGLGVLEKVHLLPMENRPLFIMLSAIGQDKITLQERSPPAAFRKNALLYLKEQTAPKIFL